MITNQILQFEPKKTRKSNITEQECLALKSLTLNQDIVIKPADKGGAIVVLNTTDYINEGLRQLNNKTFYRKLGRNPIPKISADINSFLNFIKERKLLTATHLQFLTVKNPRTPIFYMLPKIHKINNPGRPIVSACDSPTEKLSAYIDSFIKPLAQLVPSYIKDTNDFLYKLEQQISQIPHDAYLVTIDVVSLYTNIPHRDGILATKEALERRTQKEPVTWVLLRILHLVLTKTAFLFNGEYYEQISGTTMGTKCAPSYAILFMGKLEKDFLHTQHLSPLVWWRFIDDIFMIWPHRLTELYSFLEALNNFHESIKFTWDISQTNAHFLDVTVNKDNDGKIETSLYTKPTDAHLYLHYSSYHPAHQKNSIPYSQAIRLRRICSTTDNYWAAANQLYCNLTNRGYPKKLVKTALDKAFDKDRHNLLTPQSNQTNELRTDIPFIIQFNPHNPPIHVILKKNKHILTSSGDTKYMSNYHFQMVHRRALNLKQSLVRADLKLIDIPKGSGPCDKPCVTCPYMERTTTIFCSSSQEIFPIYGRFNCKTKNVIYVITCTKCGLQYVGQSSNTFNERFRNHLSDIRQENADKPVSRHFSTNSHNVKDVSAIIVTSTNGNINVRLRTEEAWIARLQSRMPNGLNLIQ